MDLVLSYDRGPTTNCCQMRLMRYMYTLADVSGKSFATADALSRAPQERLLTETEVLLTDEVTVHANLVAGVLPAREKSLAADQS